MKLIVNVNTLKLLYKYLSWNEDIIVNLSIIFLSEDNTQFYLTRNNLLPPEMVPDSSFLT